MKDLFITLKLMFTSLSFIVGACHFDKPMVAEGTAVGPMQCSFQRTITMAPSCNDVVRPPSVYLGTNFCWLIWTCANSTRQNQLNFVWLKVSCLGVPAVAPASSLLMLL